MKVKLIGIDLAKSVFQVCALNQAGRVIFNRSLRRAQLVQQLQDLEPTTVAMESCASASYWGRRFQAMGHTVRLIPPQHCKPFLRTGKSDARDALAICEAASRPNLHCVPIKTTAQQDLQLLHRIRQRHIRNTTALANQIRGMAREYGVDFPVGLRALRNALPAALEDGENELTPVAREMLHELYEELLQMIARNQALLARIVEQARTQPAYERLQTVPGIGPVVASALIAAIGNGHQFRNGRQMAAWLGLVPRQHGTGGRIALLGISKNGDRHLRMLVIHGARAALRWARGKDTPLGAWISPVVTRRGMNKAVVALANKLARISWNVVAKGCTYEPAKAFGRA